MLRNFLVLLECFVYVVHGHSRGAPKYMCLVPYPMHDSSFPKSNDDIPYNIIIKPNTYKNNSELTIIINSQEKNALKGILLTIKPKTDDIIEPVGTFKSCNSTDIRFYNSSTSNNSCLTQSTSQLNLPSISCIYKAPSHNYGPLVLTAVLIKSKRIFWINEINEIKYNGSEQETPLSNPTRSLLQNETATISGCGTLKNCILYPFLCYNKQNCQYMVSFTINKNDVDFELVGPGNGYLAMGISTDRIMNKDLVIVCQNKSKRNKPSLQTGYTSRGPRKYYKTSVDPNVYNKRSGYMKFLKNERAMICKFSLPKFQNNPINTRIPTNLSELLYIFLANGDKYRDTVIVKKHKDPPLISSSPIVLYSTKNDALYYFHEIEYYKQIHGTLMALGFMIFQPIAIVIALHFRKNLSRNIQNRQLWFSIHVSFNVIYFILIFTGYVYILYNKEFKFKNAKIHGSFGTIAITLTFINIFMGFLRPDLSSEYRKYFYWAHFTNGMLIRIFGYITFWLVFSTIKIRDNLQQWIKFVVILWTIGEFIIGGIFGILRFNLFRTNNIDRKSIKIAFIYHINNWGLIFYILFLCVLTYSLLHGLWFN